MSALDEERDDAEAGRQAVLTAQAKQAAVAAAREVVAGSDSRIGDRVDAAQAGELRALRAQIAVAERRGEDHLAEIARHRARADKAEGVIAVFDEKIAELEQRANRADAGDLEDAEYLREKERADRAEAALAASDDDHEARVIELADLRFNVQQVLGHDFRMDGMSERELRALAVKHLRPGADVSSAVSDVALAARFDSLLDEPNVRKGFAKPKTEREDARSPLAREQRAAAWRNQALNGLPDRNGGDE